MKCLVTRSVMAAASLLMTAGIVVSSEPASADVATPRTVVQTADLNLASPDGQATARRRIRAAAADLCGTEGNAMSASGQCRAMAISRAERVLQTRIAQR